MSDLEKIKNKIQLLINGSNEFINVLKENCYNLTYQKTVKEVQGGFNLDFNGVTVEMKYLPTEFFTFYRKWFATSKAIIEANYDMESLNEFIQSYVTISKICSNSHISISSQAALENRIRHQIDILQSLPAYLDGKIYNLELSIANTLMGDELKEARLLHSKKFYRAAGALAGVVLERHLKFRFDNSNPKIKYSEKATLGQLIKKAVENNFFDETALLKLKYLNNIRIKCDHDKKDEPKEQEISDLINHTDRFVNFIE